MNIVILLNKLNTCEDQNLELYQHYLNAVYNRHDNLVDEFNACIDSIKYLTNKQYDFNWLSENSKIFNVTRRDFRELCDSVCVLLGNKLNDIGKQTREPIITEPTRYEDYCPYNNEKLVLYGNYDGPIRIDGKLYNKIDTKLESTPYYNINCSMLSN